MNHDRITNSLLEEQEITAAKTSLEMSIQRFEMSLDNLAHRIGTTMHSIQHIKDVAGAPKRLLLNAKGTVQDYSGRAITTVRQNPRPFIYTAVGVIGASVALYFWLRKPAPLTTQAAGLFTKNVYKPYLKPAANQVEKTFAASGAGPYVKSITERIFGYF